MLESQLPERLIVAQSNPSCQLVPPPACLQEEVVLESGMLSNSSGAEISSSPPGGRPPLLAHRGFLARARSIPIQQLYAEARARGKRLVLTGEWPAAGGRLEGWRWG